MNSPPEHKRDHFGQHDLPQQQQEAFAKAKRLERLSILVRVFTVPIIFALAGSSQAMKASWIEDSLGFIAPIAFLIAARLVYRQPTPKHPYGYHRAFGVGHLVAAVALLTFGGYLLVDSATGLLTGEHPPIGMMELFGVSFWAGWLMAGASVVVVIPLVILGRMKIKLAPLLHNKMLQADAAMDKADWMTGLATGVGILAVGAGIWWADVAAAIVISFDILRDGVKNLRSSLSDLIDTRITSTDSSKAHPLLAEVRDRTLALEWVKEAELRSRDQGQVFHTEVFAVPRDGSMPSLEELEQDREYLSDLDWKLHDLVIIPVAELPEEFLPQLRQGQQNG